ncbi:MAG: aminopeptidase [Nanoarchaeota archaeon]|nr:aminopeptidase [Nanoarchaeota archaeon]
MKTNDSKLKKLQLDLAYEKKSAWDGLNKDLVFRFCTGYIDFLTRVKTEREAVKLIVKELTKKGFKDLAKVNNCKKGDKVYKIFKEKSVFCAKIGSSLENFRLVGAHIDSPRLDLKPQPFVEKEGLCLLKSHYYGGIKKYHWVNMPLAMYVVAHTKKGKVEFSLGENDNEPRFIIPDLLPHLAKEQLEKKGTKIVEGEQLGIVVGNIPVRSEEIKEKVKLNILEILNKKYGVIEKDFISADVEFVPANKPSEIGFDKSMISAYGQDDRVCTFTTLRALLDSNAKRTVIGMFVDKEEIGSMGNTGADSRILENFLLDFVKSCNHKGAVHKLFENSKSISADVTAAHDPNFPEAHDATNVSLLGHGVSVEKYGGGGGKYGTTDASSEYMSWLISLLDQKKVVWQTGELGKIDIGGGGTIAQFVAKYGLDCIDVGPCVLGMHSPNELTSKVDVYSAYLAYKTFFES